MFNSNQNLQKIIISKFPLKYSFADGVLNYCYNLTSFPDGEFAVDIKGSFHDKDVYIFSDYDNSDTSFLALIALVKAIKRLGARSITGLMTYLRFSRQSQSQNTAVWGIDFIDTLYCVGMKKMIVCDIHDFNLILLSKMQIYNITSIEIFRKEILKLINANQALSFCLPDLGQIGRMENQLEKFKKTISAVQKDRQNKNSKIIGGVSKDSCVIIDDIVDSGFTIINCLDLLKNGPKDVYCFITHAVCGGIEKNIIKKIASLVKNLWISNSLDLSEQKINNLNIVDIKKVLLQKAGLLASHN